MQGRGSDQEGGEGGGRSGLYSHRLAHASAPGFETRRFIPACPFTLVTSILAMVITMCTPQQRLDVKAKIIRIGNSRGIRIPKPLLEEAGLGEEVELRVVAEGLMVERVATARAGWAAAAAGLASESADAHDPFLSTAFDDSEWTW